MLFKALCRVFVFWPLAIILLPIPTLYATIKDLDRLPWGLDYIFGCREDGWNGTGCDPDFKRQYWRNVDGKTIQGWWPDKLGVIWSDLPLIKRWWYSYQWCALRNFAWNLRLTDWFADSIHYNDIDVDWMEKNQNEITVTWHNKQGKKRYFKRRKILGVYWDYGYEFYWDLFDIDHPWYKRIRSEGYVFNVTPFKDRSIPSIRPRKLKQ